MTFTQPYNMIYVDYKSALPLKTVTTDSGTQDEGIDQAVFFVNDPKNIDTVEADAKKLKSIDWNKFTLDANDAAYQEMTGPIENVASSSMTMVYLVAIAGAIILALILLLSIKERMYETGVLLSMGEGKIKIILQYVAEVLIIAVVAFSLSIFSGKYIGQGIGNMLLSRQIEATQQTNSSSTISRFSDGNGFRQGVFSFSRQNLQNYKPIDSINVQITNREIEEMSLAGLIIILLGTILPAINIVRYNPKTILTKVN